MMNIYYSAITGIEGARQMGEIMEAPHGKEWDGDTAAYLENLESTPDYKEGAEFIPGDIILNYGNTNPINICVVLDGTEPREIWWSAKE